MCFKSKVKTTFTFDVYNPTYRPIECAICLEEIWSHAQWCPHCEKPHHKQCLRKWNKPTCPLCRGKIKIPKN